MSKKLTPLERNLRNPLMMQHLLAAAKTVSMYMRPIAYRENGVSLEDISTLRVLTAILDKAIDNIDQKIEPERDDNQLSLDI